MITIKNQGDFLSMEVGKTLTVAYEASEEVKTTLFFIEPKFDELLEVDMEKATVTLKKETTETLSVKYAGLDAEGQKVAEDSFPVTMKATEAQTKTTKNETVPEKPAKATKAESTPSETEAKTETPTEEAKPKRKARRSRKKTTESADKTPEVESQEGHPTNEEVPTESNPTNGRFEDEVANVNRNYLYRRSPGAKLK